LRRALSDREPWVRCLLFAGARALVARFPLPLFAQRACPDIRPVAWHARTHPACSPRGAARVRANATLSSLSHSPSHPLSLTQLTRKRHHRPPIQRDQLVLVVLDGDDLLRGGRVGAQHDEAVLGAPDAEEKVHGAKGSCFQSTGRGGVCVGGGGRVLEGAAGGERARPGGGRGGKTNARMGDAFLRPALSILSILHPRLPTAVAPARAPDPALQSKGRTLPCSHPQRWWREGGSERVKRMVTRTSHRDLSIHPSISFPAPRPGTRSTPAQTKTDRERDESGEDPRRERKHETVMSDRLLFTPSPLNHPAPSIHRFLSETPARPGTPRRPTKKKRKLGQEVDGEDHDKEE
jgi:hypothetical protein